MPLLFEISQSLWLQFDMILQLCSDLLLLIQALLYLTSMILLLANIFFQVNNCNILWQPQTFCRIPHVSYKAVVTVFIYYLFIYDLFNKAVSGSDYRVMNSRVINEWRTVKGFGKQQHPLTGKQVPSKICTRHFSRNWFITRVKFHIISACTSTKHTHMPFQFQLLTSFQRLLLPAHNLILKSSNPCHHQLLVVTSCTWGHCIRFHLCCWILHCPCICCPTYFLMNEWKLTQL